VTAAPAAGQQQNSHQQHQETEAQRTKKSAFGAM